MDLREFLIGLIVAMEDFLVMIGVLSINRRIKLAISLRSSCCNTCKVLLDLWSFLEVMIDSESLGVELILHTQEISSIVHIVAWSGKVWTSFDRAFGDIKIEALISESHNLTIVNHLIFILISFLILYHSSEDHDFLTRDLGCSCVNNPKFEVISDIVDGFPDIFLNVKSLNLLNVVKGELSPNSSFRLEALSSNNENILLVELAHTKCLSRLLKAG